MWAADSILVREDDLPAPQIRPPELRYSDEVLLGL